MRAALVGRVARTEILLHLRDGRIRVAILCSAILCATAFVVGWKRHADGLRAVAAAQSMTHEQFLTQGRKNPHSAAHFGVYAFRPEGPLAFLDPGLDDSIGIAVFVEPHNPNRFRDPPLADKTALARLGSLTVADVLTTLFPLLIIFVIAPSLARERERGLLRLHLAQGLSRLELCAGKGLGGCAVLGLALLPALAALAIAVLVFPTKTQVAASRVALAALAYCAYLLIHGLVALGASARSGSVRAAIVAGLAFWVLTTVVGPRLGAEVASRWHRTPTALDFQAQVSRNTWGSDFSQWDQRELAIKAAAKRQYGVARDEDLPVNVAGLVLMRQEEDDAAGFDRSYGALFATLDRQEQTLRAVSLLAPALAVRSASMAAAGTDLPHRLDFWWAVERYRRSMMATINQYIATRSRTPDGYTFTADREVWDLVPPFNYDPPASPFAFTATRGAVACLLLWLCGSLTFALISARAMSVED